MPETRKYDPTTGDPIGDAVRAALGETIRPNVPGGKPAASGGSASGAPSAAAGVGTPGVGTPPAIATLGAYTFTTRPAPTRDAAPQD